MFRPSSILQAPVVTLLSPSLAASKKAAGLLSSILSSSSSSPASNATVLPPDSNNADTDELDNAFMSSFPGLSRSCQSVGVVCPLSNVVIHFCSISYGKENDDHNAPFALLSITESATTATNDNDNLQQTAMESIRHCRQLLATQFQQKQSSTTQNLKRILKSIMKRPLTPADLLHETDGLPLLSLEQQNQEQREEEVVSNDDSNPSTFSSSPPAPFLKEIVVPFFDYAEYQDGSTILSKLSQANDTIRPAVGVYQWPYPSKICIRPLPTAAEDKRLPPPSLIFHCENSADDVIASVNTSSTHENAFQKARIGYSGGGGIRKGQTMLLHDDFQGLDVRLCPSQTTSSHFSEAQESLLAGSLPELQNSNILLAGGGEQAVDDERTNNSDCWVEVRANLKRPTGFLTSRSNRQRKVGSSSGGSVKQQKIAKIPDLPYE